MGVIQIKDGNSTLRSYQVIGDGTASYPFQPIVIDHRLALGIREIEVQYGEVVSVYDKGKQLRKFGRNAAVGTSFETVAIFQGTTANETFVTTNIIDSIVSSSASDTSQTIVVEGHTVDVSGNLTFVTQDAVLTGQTEVTLSTPMARANRAYVKQSGTFGTTPTALVGDIYIYDNTDGISAGVPTTAAATKLMIEAGETNSQKCATSISSLDYYLVDNFSAAVGNAGATADRVEIVIEKRDVANGGAWLAIGRRLELTVGANGVDVNFDPIILIPKNHDIRVRARTNAGTAEVTAMFSGHLASIV